MSDIKISELSAVTSLADTDLILVSEDAGANFLSKKITSANLNADVKASIQDDLDAKVETSDWNQNGFENLTDSTITFTDATRTFSIQPTATSFNYFVEGTKFTSTGDTKVITDTEGIWVFYYDSSGLQALNSPSKAQVDDVIRTKAIVSILYWDSSESKQIYFGEERHGKSFSPAIHSYLHFYNGLIYLNGLGLNNISSDGSGTIADAQFGVDAGSVSDEDLYSSINAVTSTTGLPIYYMTGSTPDWNKTIVSGYSMRTYDNTSATRLAWNEYTGGSWQLTEITNNDFVLCHIFATTESTNPMIAIMGQNDYTSKRNARAGAKTEILSLYLDNILFPEIRPIATLIFKSNTTYSSDINAIVVTDDDGNDYIDWRSETISKITLTSSAHSDLTGLTEDDHTQYILADGSRAFTDGIQPASLADASASNNTIYYSTTASKLVYKDSGGTVNNLY